MVELYAVMVQRGLKQIDEVPARYRDKVKALLITHGHEDHIGGIPFLLKSINVPCIYAPKLAAALIRHKLAENNIRDKVKIVEIDEDMKRIGMKKKQVK